MTIPAPPPSSSPPPPHARRAALRAQLERIRARFRPFPRRPTLRELALTGLVLGAFAFLLWERCGIRGCPNAERLVSYQPGGATVLLDRDGRRFADLAPVRREIVPLESLPDHVHGAFVAVEDKRFYQHNGVDWRRFAGAFLANVRARGVAEGFSTITMQLARNIFPDRLPGQKRTLRRKVLEIRVAREIEDKFAKDEILELYLNHIYFGNGAYGIEAAAEEYFGRSAKSLLHSQAALLAGMIKGPSVYDPRRRPERARDRRNLILRVMAEQGVITESQARAAQAARLGVRDAREIDREQDDRTAPYFAQAVRRELEDRFGEDIYTSRLRVYTTLDRRVQRIAEEELGRQLRAIERGTYGRFSGDRYRASADAEEAADFLQGAIVVLDAEHGDVLGLVGGRDPAQSGFDRATRARRQLGSSFKPFVFAVALEEGYAPSQSLADDTFRIEMPGGEVWEPQNFFGEYEGKVTLREALVRSKNVPTVRLAEAVGRGAVERLAHRAGVQSDIPNLPSMALGTAGVSPLEAAAAYTAFAQSGTAVEPRFVLRVEDQDERVIWRKDPNRSHIMNSGVAFILTDLLREAVNDGTATAVRTAGFRGPAAGKTGTTNDANDVWFVGYTPDLVASVWIGFDQPRQILPRASGGRLAAPVWGRVMRRVYEQRPRPSPWPEPEDVVKRRIDPATGLVLAKGCRPKAGASSNELFLAGKVPAETCPRGREPEEGPGFFDRLFARVRTALHRTGEWFASHFGREENVPPPSARDRYLGVPRLPREDELPFPEVDPELYEAPRFEDRIIIPEIPPFDGETIDARLQPLDSVLMDSIVLPDATVRDTVVGDTTNQ